MIQDIKNLIKHGATYGAGIILGKIVSFIMLPVYTRYLTPADYGVLELLVLTSEIISMILGAGISHAIFRFYHQYEDQKDRIEVVSTALLSTLLLYSIFFIPLFFYSSFFSNLIFYSKDYTFYFKLSFFNLLLSAGYEIPMGFIQARQKSTQYIVINLSKLILQLSLNIYFVINLGKGVEGILYSAMISSIATSSYLTIITFKNVHFNFSMQKARELLYYGIPLIFSDIGAFLLTFSDRFFLKYYANLSDVGIYSLGYKIGMLIPILVIAPFNQVWSVQMFKIAQKENSGEIFRKVFTYFSMLVITVGLAISLLSKDTIKIISNAGYWDAYKIVPIVVLAYIIYGFYIQSLVGILVEKKTVYLALMTVAAAISNILFNFLLIPSYTTTGAAWATVLSFLIRFLGIYFISKRLVSISYEWAKVTKLLILAIIFYLIHLSISIENIPLSFSLNMIFILFFLIVIYMGKFLDNIEKEWLLKAFRRPFNTLKILYTESRSHI